MNGRNILYAVLELVAFYLDKRDERKKDKDIRSMQKDIDMLKRKVFPNVIDVG